MKLTDCINNIRNAVHIDEMLGEECYCLSCSTRQDVIECMQQLHALDFFWQGDYIFTLEATLKRNPIFRRTYNQEIFNGICFFFSEERGVAWCSLEELTEDDVATEFNGERDVICCGTYTGGKDL